MQRIPQEQLMGRYRALTRELAKAYTAVPWRVERIDRLADEIASTEQELVALGTVKVPH